MRSPLSPIPAGALLAVALALPAALTAQVVIPDAVPDISEILRTAEDEPVEAGEGVAFGVGVVNPRGDFLEFEWDLGDGSPTVAGRDLRAVTHRYTRHGQFTVTVRVSGNEAGTITRQREMEIHNAAPTIHGLSHEDPMGPDAPILFRAEATDPGDDDLTYHWDFGDGSPPQQGIDLRNPTHPYDSPGRYRVTLTVTDEDGLDASRSILVGVNPGFLGEVGGGIPPFPFAGEPGRAALMNALPGSRAIPIFRNPLFSGAAPLGGGIVDLSDEFGVCFVMGGFWDETSKAHINFAWTPASDRVFEPRTYPVGWASSNSDGIPPDQLMVNALILEIDPSYEDTRAGAEELQVFEFGGLLDLIKGALAGAAGGAADGAAGGLLGRLLGGRAAQAPAQPQQVGPGRNYQLTSSVGSISTTRVSEDRIQGELDVTLHGAWMGGEGSGSVDGVRFQGEFDWRLDEEARAGLSSCGSMPFTIASHSPATEQMNTSFASPEIVLRFLQAVQPATVTSQTLQVGYLVRGGEFETIDGTLLVAPDGLTVRFTPSEPLMGAVYYHVRVRGGDNGIRSATGETLPEDYQWRFATVVNLLEPGH